MFPRVTRPATAAALVVALGLAALPACKKKPKATEPDSPVTATPPGPVGPPGPNANANSGRDPAAPRSPVFGGGSDPRTATMRAEAEGNLKQIMLALHNYESANGTLPGGYADKDGKPGLSWRVAILPYLEQDNLFKQFKLDEPWDSANNKPLLTRMPKTLAPPREETRGYTFYRGFTGPNTWLPPQQAGARPGQALRGAKFTDFTDGLSNTIVVAEAYEPVLWTKPDEVVFDPSAPPKLGGVFATGFMAGLGDGSVRFVRPGMSQKALANAIQINDGNIVEWGD